MEARRRLRDLPRPKLALKPRARARSPPRSRPLMRRPLQGGDGGYLGLMSAVVKDYFQAGVKRPGSRAKRSHCSFLHELDHWSRVCPAGSALEVEAAKDELSAHREANDFSVPKTDDKPVGLDTTA